MKAVWQGSLAFGLVNIPIKLYSAAEPKQFSFRLLCGECGSPLKYKKYCMKCKKEVVWSNVVRGIEISKGKFYALSKEKLEGIKPEKSDIIEIISFIDPITIDPIYFFKNYYMVPAKKKEKAYFLFHEALKASAKVALGRFVFKEKEYNVMIRPFKSGLLLTTLHYSYEIRNLNRLEELKEKLRIKKEELLLALELIDKFSKKEVSLERFKDEYAEKIKALVLGRAVKETKTKKGRAKKLLDALKLSIKKY